LPVCRVAEAAVVGNARRMRHAIALLVVVVLTAPGHADPLDTGPPAAPDTSEPHRWLSVGVLSEPQHYDATRGVWAELDVVNINGWTLDAALTLDKGTEGLYDQSRTAQLDRTDIKAIASITRAARFQRFELRGSLGAGLVRTTATGDMMDRGMVTPIATSDVFPVAEASARVTVPISPKWAITAGPTATYYDQYFKFVGGTRDGATHRLGELVLVGGLSFRL
jgi:hypothetical protein